MTSLPITIPKGYTIVVNKGDAVTSGQVLAKRSTDESEESNPPIQSEQSSSEEEVSIDLAEALGVNPTAARKYLEKAPGDSVTVGDVVASKGMTFGLKREQILSSVSGTIIRFERDTGKLFIRTSNPITSVVPQSKQDTVSKTILAPLAGTITVCDNDSIVIESESKTIVGSEGSGGVAKGEVVVISPLDGKETVHSTQITKEYAGKIILLPSIDKEAVAKASAIDVAGVLGTAVPSDLFSYLQSRKIDLPIIVIDPAVGKKLVKGKTEVIMHGVEKTVIPQE